MTLPKECPQVYGNDEKYDLHRVIISTGYYGSCTRCDPLNKHQTCGSSHLNDATPLLNNVRPLRNGKHINVRIFSLGVLFIGGVTIGSYLLYCQDRPWPVNLVFDFVNREEWGAQLLPTGHALNNSGVLFVLLYHTGSRGCDNFNDCKELLRQMQSSSYRTNRREIPFNFLIGSDGRTYEGRGWSIQSGHTPIREDMVLSIAFMGNFTVETPSERQLNAGLALLSELEFQRKVASVYSILGVRNLTKSHHDGTALFALTTKWKRWDEVLNVH